jgi:hypothetical protein
MLWKKIKIQLRNEKANKISMIVLLLDSVCFFFFIIVDDKEKSIKVLI